MGHVLKLIRSRRITKCVSLYTRLSTHPVEAPETAHGGGMHRGRTRGVVEKGQLAKGAPRANVRNVVAVDDDLALAFAHAVELVGLLVPLRDDVSPRGHLDALERTDDDVKVLVVESEGPSNVSMTVMEGMKAGVNDYAVSCGAADWYVSVWVYGRATPRGVTTRKKD